MTPSALEWFLIEFKKQVWFEPNSELDIWINDLMPVSYTHLTLPTNREV